MRLGGIEGVEFCYESVCFVEGLWVRSGAYGDAIMQSFLEAGETSAVKAVEELTCKNLFFWASNLERVVCEEVIKESFLVSTVLINGVLNLAKLLPPKYLVR